MKKFKEKEKSGLTIEVRNNDVNGALRVLKKRMQTEGIFNEIRERTHFKTKGEKKRLAKSAGKRRHLKSLEKRMEEHGY